MSDQTLVIIERNITQVVAQPNVTEVVIQAVGAQGPEGPQGVPGVAGGHYQHVQSTPSSFWVVLHNLGIQPNIAVIVDGEDVTAGVDIFHDSLIQATITSNVPIAGEAECS